MTWSLNVESLPALSCRRGELMGVELGYLAVGPSSISPSYTEGENRWVATMNATLDQLEAAPVFRYEGKWRR
jgi:hypothetical protein